jgi:hypothetical protein
LPLLGAGLPLPTSVGLPGRLLCDGAPAGDPAVLALLVGVGLADGLKLGGGALAGGWEMTGAALVGDGAGTDETCETCETWEICPPEPDT